MMTINLARGFYNAIEGHRVIRSYFEDTKYPCGRHKFEIEPYLAWCRPINEVYGECMASGMSGEDTIDYLLDLYFPLKYFRVGSYKEMVMVLGFIGSRGSGKTCSAVAVAVCDFLLRGLPVWSNVPIEVKVIYKDAVKYYSSNPLSELDMLDLTTDYGSGCVVYDEINMEAAEATRFSSSANLAFSYALQQIRKRQLTLLWTCQGWNWVDNRLRWQSDYVIACREGMFEKNINTPAMGHKSVWRVHDLSGISGKFDFDYELKHHFISDFLTSKHLMYLRPWWGAYSTELLQGQENYMSKYKVSMKEKASVASQTLGEPVKVDLPEVSNTVGELVQAVIAEVSAGKMDTVYCNYVWGLLDTKDRKIQSSVGKMFKDAGFKKAGNSVSGRYWIKGEG